MPRAIDVGQFGVDPTATCGDAGSASTKDYRIETSTNGTTWTVANTGTFTATNRGKVNLLTPAAGGKGVRYLRFTGINPQVPGAFAKLCAEGGYSGCAYLDLTELEVYGTPSP